MLVSDYDRFVQESDQSTERPVDDRLDIAMYGLASEIGSVVAAIKKRLLSNRPGTAWNSADAEIIEELGDVIWYCFSLARAANPSKPINIFSHDVSNLKREIGATDARADRIRSVLDATKRQEFLDAAEHFPKRSSKMVFEDYQDLAFLTARTEDRTLAEVCLAVLWQLSAQLFRRKLPDIEKELNQSLQDRPINDALGEIAWHVSALASIYGLKLSDIARRNVEKGRGRWSRSDPTPLHDEPFPPGERFPRVFKVTFVTIARGKSRMYVDGRQVGDDLTDNAYSDDGYRFHDVMHLANVAKLGWSPVLRSLLGLKRKSSPKIDEIEDGARAKIVEEAVIKAIHSEGVRLSALDGKNPEEGPRLFPDSSSITFGFLKFISSFVVGHEVEKNQYWEWEEAILSGYEIFHKLRTEGQGTVTVDLLERTITFEAMVFLTISGKVAGFGMSKLSMDDVGVWNHQDPAPTDLPVAEAMACAAHKRAILSALDILEPTPDQLGEIAVYLADGNSGVSVKARGSVQEAMWTRKVVGFRVSCIPTGAEVVCTALAISDG